MSAEIFIGRERETVQLAEILAAGRSACLVGPAGSGKTMILQHMARSAALVLDASPEIVQIDLRSVRLAADFYGPLLDALGHAGADELDAAQALEASPTPPLLLLDNLEQAGSGWTALLRSALRGWINARRMLVIAASATPLAQAAPDMEAVLVQITLGPLPEREARALISTQLAARGTPADAASERTILVAAGGAPNRIVRAVELWQRAQRDGSDWQRLLTSEFPTPPGVADGIGGWNPGLESSAAPTSTTVAPAQSRLSSIRAKPKAAPSYRAEDPSDFLLMIGMLALAGLVGLTVSGWPGVAASLLILLGISLVARSIVRQRSADTLFTRAARQLPGFGRLIPRTG